MNLRPGLFGPRRPFVGGRLAAYRIVNAPASIHPATQREAGREGRADAPRSPVGSPPISTTICPNCGNHDTIYLRSGGALVCRECAERR